MQIILLEKIDNLGDLGALVNVKPGFARNYLIPQGKATIATEENKVEFENRRHELEQAAQAGVRLRQKGHIRRRRVGAFRRRWWRW